MELAGINTPAAAFTAGLVTSLHCAAMCGPLACMLGPARHDRVSPQTVATVYHLFRVAGYSLLGAGAGALGSMPLGWLSGSSARFLPWVLVVFFVLIAFRCDRHLPRPIWLLRTQWRLQTALRGRSRLHVAAVMGAATPLLPCGPLYMVVALAAFSGSALRGVEFMLAFGLGTVPLLWIAQANFGWLRTRLSPTCFARVRATIALAAALVIAWRLRGTLGLGGPDADALICHFP